MVRFVPIRSLLSVACVVATLAFAPHTATAQALSDEQRKAVEAIVRDYLVKNPEVIQDALGELERRHDEAQKVAQAKALSEAEQTLLRSPYGNVVGNPSGNVTLVEFFDYNCGYCKRAVLDVKTLVKADPNLRVVLRDLTIIGGDASEAASRVALAAKQQISGDRLFDYHTRLLTSPGKVDGPRALTVAKEMGLDLARLQKDAAGPDVQAALKENAELGEKLNLSGTPAFVIGDTIIPGAVGTEPLKQAIVSVRQCGRAAC